MMQPKITKEWIEKADEDFGFAVISLDSNDYFSQICFHFQQAAEKYLKAFIIANELEFRPIHNLVELLEICKCKESSMDKAKEACLYLNPFYIDTRYPVHWPTNYNKEIAIKAKNMAKLIRNLVKDILNV